MPSASAALSAANTVVAVRPTGMTPTAYIMLVLVLTTVPLLAGILIALIKRAPMLKKIDIEQNKLDDESDASLRRDLLGRIDKLEASLSASDARCDARMASMQRDYESRIDGLTRQLVALQISIGRDMGFTPNASASAERVMAHIERKQEDAS